jgi:hypothetical protein
MKYHVVLTAEQKDFALGRGQFAAQSFCKLHRRKSSTDDDDSDWFHFFTPVPGCAEDPGFSQSWIQRHNTPGKAF